MDVNYNEGNNNANNVSTHTKPAESLLDDDKDDNDEVFSAIRYVKIMGSTRESDSCYLKRRSF